MTMPMKHTWMLKLIINSHSFVCRPEKKDGNINNRKYAGTNLVDLFFQTKMTHLSIFTKPSLFIFQAYILK